MLTPEDLKRIGGSDVAAIMGVHPKSRPIDVYRRIVEGHVAEETKAMRRGTLLEPVIRQLYREERPEHVLLGPSSLKAPYPWMRSNIDDRAKLPDGNTRTVEFKSADPFTIYKWGPEGTDEVPQEYICQVNFYLRLTGDSVADLACYFGGDQLRIYTLVGDKELQEILLEGATKFYQDHIEPRIPPPVDGSGSYSEWLGNRFPSHVENKIIYANEEQEGFAREFIEAKNLAAHWDEQQTHKRNLLIAALGDAEALKGGAWKATYKQVKGKLKTDWEQVAKELGAPEELIQRYTTPGSPYRRFLLTEQKQKGAK